VLIVDDGSSDGTESAVKGFISASPAKNISWKYLRQPQLGPAAARNRGIDNAQGDYILFLGDDIIPEEHLISVHMRLLQNNPLLGSIGLVAWHPASRNPKMLAFRLSWIEADYRKVRDQSDCDFTYFCTANAAISRDLLSKERFDEDFAYPAMEDTELGYRLKAKGARFVLNKEALAYHLHHYEEEDLIRRQERIGSSIALLVEKHPQLKARFIRKKDKLLLPLAACLARLGFVKRMNKGLYWSAAVLYHRYKNIQ